MPKVALNKSSLQREKEQLKMYRQVLPSLELKRQQLNAELARAKRQLAEAQEELTEFMRVTSERIPMLSNHQIDLSSLVQVVAIDLKDGNVAGVHLPVLDEVRCKLIEYSCLAKPHWVDAVQRRLYKAIRLAARLDVARQRAAILVRAARRITQRVNLFTEVLIPSALKNIKLIKVALAENERQSVIRSKITKAKRLKSREKIRLADEAAL